VLPEQVNAAVAGLGDADGLGEACAEGWLAACADAAGWAPAVPWLRVAGVPPAMRAGVPAGLGVPALGPCSRSARITAASEWAVATSGPSAAAGRAPADAASSGVNCQAAKAPMATTAGSAIPSRFVDFCAAQGAQWRPVLLNFLCLRCL